jgi:hypothetical protein
MFIQLNNIYKGVNKIMNDLNFYELELINKLVANHFDNGEPTDNEWELSETLTTKLINQLDSLPLIHNH